MKIQNYKLYTNLSLDDLLLENKRNKENEDNEIWKKIYFKADEESIYSVSNYGRIRNDDRNKILSQEISSKIGYHRVKLYFEPGKCKSYLVHILVASAFCKIREGIIPRHVHHIDGNPENNKYWNLIWLTVDEHIRIHESLDYYNPKKGEEHPFATHKNEEVDYLCKLIESNPTYSNKHLSSITNFTCNEISSIRCGMRWKDISSKYNLNKIRKINRKISFYNTEQIHKVCELICEGKSNQQISLLTGVSHDVVSKIRHGDSYKDISKEYKIDYTKKGKYVRTR